MAADETQLEMASRHGCQGDRIVSRQIEIIAKLRLQNKPTELAEKLLIDFQDILHAYQEH